MNLLAKLKELVSVPTDDMPVADLLPLAVTTLLLEVAASDHHLGADELQHVQDAIANRFELSNTEAAQMLSEARAEHDRSVGMFAYAQSVNAALDADEKRRLLQELWELAYSDADLHRYEEHVIRRISELLYIPHRDFIAAKHAARDAQNTSE